MSSHRYVMMKTARERMTHGLLAQEESSPMPPHLTPHQRFWAKVNKNGPVPYDAPQLGSCWLWKGPDNGTGYCQFTAAGRMVYVHRWAYEQEYGPVPPGLQCDHLCRVRQCVRPSHIEPVTHRVNLLRGTGPSARNSRKTHCIHGHPFDEANTRHRPDGRRECRACHREWERRARLV